MFNIGLIRSGSGCKTPFDMWYPSKLIVSVAYLHLPSFSVRLHSFAAFRKTFKFTILFLRPAAHRDVKIRECAVTTMSSNDVIDDTLKTRNSVFQGKRNPLKLAQLAITFESRIFSLFWQQRHLVVCRAEIQTRVPLVLSHVIDNALHVRQRISIKACNLLTV